MSVFVVQVLSDVEKWRKDQLKMKTNVKVIELCLT